MKCGQTVDHSEYAKALMDFHAIEMPVDDFTLK
jgi:hypothetical protein